MDIWPKAQGVGPQFSIHFSIIKKKEIKDYSTQCCSNLWKNKKQLLFMNSTLVLQYPIHSFGFFCNILLNRCHCYSRWVVCYRGNLSKKYRDPHSTVILREYFKNIPLKSCNIAKIFIKLLERFLKYCRNLAMSAQNIINVMLLQYWYFILILL